MSRDGAGRGVEGDRGGRVEIVAGPLIAEPRSGVAGAPEGEIGFGVVIAGYPHGCAAALVVIAAARPGLAAGFSRGRDREGPPQLLAGFRIISGEESPDPQLAARWGDQHLAVDDERHQCHVVTDLVVIDLGGPNLLAGLCIECDQHRLRRREINLVAEKSDATVGRMQRRHVFGQRTLVTPQKIAGLGFQRQQLVAGGGYEHHTIVHDRRGLMTLGLAGRKAPHRLQPAHIVAVDPLKRTETPAIVSSPEQQPVAVLRLFESIGCDRRVLLKNFRHRARYGRGRGRRNRLLR